MWKGYKPSLKYLKVWGCLAKVMLPGPKKRKIGYKTSDCLFIGYAENSAAYRFLVLKSDVLSCNTIVETKNVEFLENVFPLKVASVSDKPFLNKEDVNSYDDLRRSKRQRKETSFRNDFYTYLVEN